MKLLLIAVLLMSSCMSDSEYLFKSLPSNHTHIDFINSIEENADLNILNFHYIYNGGGVGIGDFNNDGLEDIVFTGNQVDSKLYMNKGNLEFEDVSKASGFESKGWSTGVAIVDINDDGWLDIYISTGGYDCEENCYNQLFINQKSKDISFVEAAVEYGLEDGHYTQQAAFFDFDNDGDLDVYLLHNASDKRDKNAPTIKATISPLSKDQFLVNREGKFVDISDEIGIKERGYGLGITISDFNDDRWPDIYVANDFLSDDLLYINKGEENGEHLGFREQSHDLLKHTSYNSMGVDVADVDNNGTQDILVVDMMPAYNERQKTMIGFMNYNKFKHALRNGYNAQFVRNTLQLGNGMLGNEVIPFSEVGHMTGLYNTDWSWGPLMADFDNDGDKDIFISNGYGKDITDLDFINYTNQSKSPFGTPESRQADLYKVVEKMEAVKMPNYMYENEGQLNFSNRNNEWMDSRESISNGSAYADLDNDGDLDLVVNNIDQPAFIMENRLDIKKQTQKNGNWVSISGMEIGSSLTITRLDRKQVYVHSPVRGYLSTMGNKIHIGLGSEYEVGLEYVSQSGGVKEYYITEVNRQYDLSEMISSKAMDEEIEAPVKMKMISDSIPHVENIFQDFNTQPLLLAQHSLQGPCIAVGNIDGKPGDEYFIGGSKRTAGQLVFPNEIRERRITLPHVEQEDTDATFFDFEGDGDLDLYVVTGGVEGFAKDSYQDRLYINDGNGKFTESEFQVPVNMSGGCIAVADYDNDGDVDLFIGGRVSPGNYPQSPQSKLLINHVLNTGERRFLDYTDKLSNDLSSIGMVSDAEWVDMDGDNDLDLLLAGEWMSIQYYLNNNGHLFEKKSIANSKGLWNCISSGDFDKDGDVDVIVGNHGFNSRLQASEKEPMFMYKGDYDKNNSQDPIIGQYYPNKKGERKLFPLHSRDNVMGQIVSAKNRYGKYHEFGEATLFDILETEDIENDFLSITNLASSFLINNGGGNFELKDMPHQIQMAPVQDVFIDNRDSKNTIYIVGNDYTREKNNGWMDASNGWILESIGNGEFHLAQAYETGFLVSGDARDIVQLENSKGEKYIIVGQNKGPLLKFIQE